MTNGTDPTASISSSGTPDGSNGVRRIGRYFPLGPGGVVLNDAGRDRIDEASWQAARHVDRMIRTSLTPRAVYLRGSVARGLAIPDQSDLDVLVVVDPGGPDPAPLLQIFRDQARPALPKELRSGGVDLEFTVPERLLFGRTPEAMAVSTQSVLVSGEPLHRAIRPFVLGAETAVQLKRLESDALRGRTRHATSSVRWLARRTLRAALELAAVPAHRYTRDLYLCCETATDVFPAFHEDLRHALHLAIRGPAADTAPEELEELVATGRRILATPAAAHLVP